ncbi:M4 family metallopeptidase [Enterovibrio paralichthyis]|uniref:M4 family metallopeptidase n=1 Tax=Enterovibrio paralichthyis TaxID=2853805 RepID=UPI001C48982C|nr:pre-peptidase C-terminal domain-containing protein [Enterovibrio paralichthyis]MBV7298444.1 M4 family metallopeptidase [Enterovibrio paralichthyis]
MVRQFTPVLAVLCFNLLIPAATAKRVAVEDAMLSASAVSSSALKSGSSSSGFYPVETVVLPNGKVKVKHQQYYLGTRVLQGQAVSDKVNNAHVNARGKMVAALDSEMQSVTPAVSGQRALQILKNQHLFQPPAAEIVAPENEAAELLIWLDENDQPRLVYKVSFFLPTEKPTRPHAFIDAKSGEILKTWDGLTHVEATGTGPGGNTKTGLYQFGNDYNGFKVSKSGTTCTMETANVKTVDLNHGTSGSTAFSYSCGDSTNYNSYKAVNGAYSPLNDAHFFGQLVFDMYQDWLGFAPLNFQLVMRVHYSSNYENAFWNGSSMTFGDGYTRFFPLVDVNVSAHEVSHGFTDQNSDLIYSGMSGGINEAFSDIAGEAAEYYWKGSVDWQVGTDIFKSNGALRYFITPSDDGSSIDHASEYYSGIDVHYSSGVFNRAFYLLATTTGWDVRKAFEAFAFANKLYWAADSTFDEGGCGVVQAASDLGYNTTDVTNAFQQVGVYACLDATALSHGVPVTNISGGIGSESYYYFSLPANTDSATVTLSGGSGNANLYVKYNGWPTTTDYDCASLSATNEEVCDVTLSGSGEYNVLVAGQTAYSNATITLAVTETPPQPLNVGDSVSGLYGNRGDALFYRFVIPDDGSDLRVAISGGSGDADLYLNQGSTPSQSDYDCRPYYYGNNEYCVASGAPGDEFYVMLHGYANFSGVTLSLVQDSENLPPEQRADPIDTSAPISDIQGLQGQAIYYSFTVSGNGSLSSASNALSASAMSVTNGVTISLSGGLGDADLYVRGGAAPTTTLYDCRSISNSNQESCSLSSLGSGTYYVMIYGNLAFEGATLSLSETSSSPTTTAAGGGGGAGYWIPVFALLAIRYRRYKPV